MPRGSLATLVVLVLCAWCVRAEDARAAGIVMNVGVSSGKLAVSGGTSTSSGFADQTFLDGGPDGYSQAVNISGFGFSNQWTTPGVRITGMKTNSGLYIEALAVPDSTASPARDRVLWYWSGITQSLEEPSIDNHFLIYKTFAGQGIYISATDTATHPPLKMASPVTADLDIDTYGTYAKFALHNEFAPPIGVYGVFARFKSDQYEPSDPFLLIFNHGRLSPTLLTNGALAINAAAGGGGGGPTNGDFNGDGHVDAADYSVWRNGLGTTYNLTHYALWKRDFGLSFGGASSGSPVPEPAIGATLAVLTLLLVPHSRRRPRRSVGTCSDSTLIFLDWARESS